MPSIIFMGTPEFAIASMNAIHQEYGIKAVVTLPDKQSGRGRQLSPTPVKLAAQELSIPVLTPISLKDPDFLDQLAELQPDIIVVVAFRILPKECYSLARLGAFNIHGSLLPKYRGAAPVQWAIINGEQKTGVTSFLLNDTVDTGQIIAAKELDIKDNMTAGELFDALTPLGAELAVETCSKLLSGTVIPQTQDDSIASPAPKLFREQCKIDCSNTAETLKNFIHGVNPKPGAWTIFNNKIMKFLKADVVNTITIEPNHFLIQNNSLFIGCNGSTLNIIRLQDEGKPVMNTADYLRGYRGPLQGVLQ